MINLFIFMGCALDLILTKNFLELYKKRFPKKDYTVVETNPLIRNAIRSMGIRDGVIFSGVIIIMLLLVLLSMLPYHWKYFLAGVYYMMVCFHLINFLSLKRMEVKKHGRRKSRK